MKIAKLCYDPSFCNTYVLGEEGEPCLLIDPGYNKNGCLNRFVKKHHGGKILAILLTHGHYDHFAGMGEIEGLEHIPLYFSQEDEICFGDPKRNASFSLRDEAITLGVPYDSVYCYDGQEVSLDGFSFRVIATPFHTKGSLCFYFPSDGVLFSGDTLFHLSIGRDDLPHAAPRMVGDSLRKLKALPPSTLLCPGHGPNSTLEEELRLNEAFQEAA